jgi:2-dehydro-3-deoxy-D-arabinonate dehydratase
MNLISFQSGESKALGLWKNEEVINLTKLNPVTFGSFTQLSIHSHKYDETIEQTISKALKGSSIEPNRESLSLDDKRVLIPLDPAEVWACGVTYRRSQEAREYETDVKGIYDLVYDAERPEIFFKTTGIRCVGTNQKIGIRGDSSWSVPEPELAFIIGPDCQVVGFTAGNDVSARDIEGENPLYLPQAKIFESCCALGPSIVTIDEVGIEPSLEIKCEIRRDKKPIFSGFTNTDRMKRSIDELRSYLCKYNPIPPGSVCLTGTGIVPPDDFSLQKGDIINIKIEKIGTLKNTVKRLKM